MISVDPEGSVVYRASNKSCVPYPAMGDETFKTGVKRNFQALKPLDFLAEVTQHIMIAGATLFYITDLLAIARIVFEDKSMVKYIWAVYPPALILLLWSSVLENVRYLHQSDRINLSYAACEPIQNQITVSPSRTHNARHPILTRTEYV